MLQNEEFDLALTFSAGGDFDVMYPHTNNKFPIFSRFARTIKTTGESSTETCSPSSINQKDQTGRLTELFYKFYKVPLFTVDLGCCKMPGNEAIASTWRHNLKKMLNFLQLLETGIEGYVKDELGDPIRSAIVKVEGNSFEYRVTKNQAHFKIVLPTTNTLSMVFSATGYATKVIPIIIDENTVRNLGNIVLRKRDDSAMQVALLEEGSPKEHPDEVETAVVKVIDEKIGQKAAVIGVVGGGVIDISGYVLDVSNHPIGNAKVSVGNSTTKFVFTDSSGEFKLTGLETGGGDVQLLAEAPRHKKQSKYVWLGRTPNPVVFFIDVFH